MPALCSCAPCCSNGYTAGSTAIKHFWQVVREMSQVRCWCCSCLCAEWRTFC